MVNANWFDVDRRGLLQVLQRKEGKTWVLNELIQNAFDTSAANVTVTMEEIPGLPRMRLTVEDDSAEGFADLSHAFTMFAPSIRKGDAEKRGRFCIGEKLVIACFIEAKVISTTGGYRFDDKGRHPVRERTQKGTRFEGIMAITREEMGDLRVHLRRLLPPANVTLVVSYVDVNSEEEVETIAACKPEISFQAKLLTEVADADGNLRRRQRETRVDLRRTRDQAWLYELGIPIVEIDGSWHLDIQQKTPRGLESDSIPAAYLSRLQALVFNETAALLGDELRSPWVKEAIQHPAVTPEAVADYIQGTYGSKVVINDPRNPESVRQAQANGYTVIYGGAEGKHTFDVIREHSLVQPAGQAFPPPKASSNFEVLTDPPANYRRAAAFAIALAKKLLGVTITVRVIDGPTIAPATWLQNPTAPVLTFNLAALGAGFFQNGPDDQEAIDLLIHEMAHHHGDHLEEKFDAAMSKLGAKIYLLARHEPQFFDFRGWYDDVEGPKEVVRHRSSSSQAS